MNAEIFKNKFSRRKFLFFTTTAILTACVGESKKNLIQEESSIFEALKLTVWEGIKQVDLDEYEQKLTGFTNRERICLGIKPMAVDAALVAIARIRSREMANQDYFSHTRQDGTSAFVLLDRIEYPYIIAGENIARNNYPLPEASDVSFEGLMNSPGHRQNILYSDYTNFGIGHAEGKHGFHYFTQLFAQRVA